MIAATLWVEITIAGFVYLVAGAFFVLAALNVTHLAPPPDAKDFLPYVAAASIGVAYITGLLAHRTMQMVSTAVFRRLERALGLRDLSYSTDRAQMFRDNALIWQHGSARLHREIDFQYAVVALLRSLLGSIPLLGLGVAVWLSQCRRPGAWPMLSLTFVLWILCLLAYRRQREQYWMVRVTAVDAVTLVAAKAASAATVESDFRLSNEPLQRTSASPGR